MVMIYALALLFTFPRLSYGMLLVSLGLGCVIHSIYENPTISFGVSAVILLAMAYLLPQIDGFNTRTPPSEVSDLLRKMKRTEGFSSLTESPSEEKPLKQAFRGSGVIEGYEDVKKEKNETPAPAMKKDEMPMPFKLGEIPSQAKGGPHIDAGSTLMKAIQSLNPDQINAMSKDTQQLIETQKSLMGMLGTMKPMLNDGKELMETFQQMFGQ